MFKKFIQYLCESEQLVDIGKLGKATQSSLSKWSKDNDAQRAVDGTYSYQYVFHTDEEEYPWWKIKFDQAYDIRHIIINNRKNKKLNAIASKIQVFGIKEGGERVVIHEGDLTFGSLPESMPLTLPLYNSQKLIGVEIKLPQKGYLHLHTINILAKSLEIQESKGNYIFYSSRNDGLGERIRALLNVIVLSKTTNGRFYFSWEDQKKSYNEFHAVINKNELFQSDFVKDHILSKRKVDLLNLKSISDVDFLQYKELLPYDGILVQQQTVMPKIKAVYSESEVLSYKSAYNLIRFNTSILKAKELAETVKIKKKTISIHLRSGDIVYGVHRYHVSFYNKVIPIYILEYLIKKFRNEGFEVLIFGQDIDFCEGLSKEFNIVYTQNEIDPNFNSTQIAIFDITLMSRSDLIISGSSGFSTLASWIGKAPQKYYTQILGEEMLTEIFDQALLPTGILNRKYVSPLAKSFSINHYLVNYENVLDLKYKIELIDLCIELDKHNFLYKLIKSLYLFESNLFKEAEEMLLIEIRVTGEGSLSSLINSKHIKIYVSQLSFYAAQGSTVAALVLLSYESRHENTLDIKFYQNIVSNPLEGSLGIEVLKDKLNQLI